MGLLVVFGGITLDENQVALLVELPVAFSPILEDGGESALELGRLFGRKLGELLFRKARHRVTVLLCSGLAAGDVLVAAGL